MKRQGSSPSPRTSTTPVCPKVQLYWGSPMPVRTAAKTILSQLQSPAQIVVAYPYDRQPKPRERYGASGQAKRDSTYRMPLWLHHRRPHLFHPRSLPRGSESNGRRAEPRKGPGDWEHPHPAPYGARLARNSTPSSPPHSETSYGHTCTITERGRGQEVFSC